MIKKSTHALPASPFGNIGRNRDDTSSDLRGQTITFLSRECFRRGITVDNKIHGSLPDLEITIASNWSSLPIHRDNIVAVSAKLLTFRALRSIVCAQSPDTR